jgi:hypothetical protein
LQQQQQQLLTLISEYASQTTKLGNKQLLEEEDNDQHTQHARANHFLQLLLFFKQIKKIDLLIREEVSMSRRSWLFDESVYLQTKRGVP